VAHLLASGFFHFLTLPIRLLQSAPLSALSWRSLVCIGKNAKQMGVRRGIQVSKLFDTARSHAFAATRQDAATTRGTVIRSAEQERVLRA
jgi:hypothetical protein